MSLNSFINPEFLEKQATHLDEGFLIGWIPGIITSIEDLEKTGRVRCSIPLFTESKNVPNAEDSMVWVLEDYTVPESYGGSHRKLEVGSQVALLPLMGNPTEFILIGCIPNRKDRPHPRLDRNAGTHGEVTPNGIQDIRFDAKQTRQVGYPNGLTYQISEKGDWQLETLESATYVARSDGNLLVDNKKGSLFINPEGDVEQTNQAGVSSLLDKDGNYLVNTSFKNKISLTKDDTTINAPRNSLGNILNNIQTKVRSKIAKAQNIVPKLEEAINPKSTSNQGESFSVGDTNVTVDPATGDINPVSNSSQGGLFNVGETNNLDFNANIVSDLTDKVDKVFQGFDEGVKAIDDLIEFPDEDLILEFDRAIENVSQKGISEVSRNLKSEINKSSKDTEKIKTILDGTGNFSDSKQVENLVGGLEYDSAILEDALLKDNLGSDYSEIKPIANFGILDNLDKIKSLYNELVQLKLRIIELQKEIEELKQGQNENSLDQSSINNENNIDEDDEENSLDNEVDEDDNIPEDDSENSLDQSSINYQSRIRELERQIEELKKEVKRTVINIQLEFPERFRRHISLFYLEALWEFPNPVSRILNRLQKSEAVELRDEISKIKEYTDNLPELNEVTSGIKERNPNKIYNKSQVNNSKFSGLKSATRGLGDLDISEESIGKLLGDYNPSEINLDSFNPRSFLDSDKTPLGKVNVSNGKGEPYTVGDTEVTVDPVTGDINPVSNSSQEVEAESLIKGLDLPNINLNELTNANLDKIDLNSLPLKDVFGKKTIKDIGNLSVGGLSLKDLAGNTNFNQIAKGDFAKALNLDNITVDDVLGTDLNSTPLGSTISSLTGGLDPGSLDIQSILGGDIDLNSIDLTSLNLDSVLGSDITSFMDKGLSAVGGIASGLNGLFGGSKPKVDDVLGFFNGDRGDSSIKLTQDEGEMRSPLGSKVSVKDRQGDFYVVGGAKVKLNPATGELSTASGTSKAQVTEGSASLLSPTGAVSTNGISSIGGLAMSALGSGGIATGLSIAKNGLMALGAFKSDKDVDDPSTIDLSQDSYNFDSEKPLSGLGIGRDFVDIEEEDSKVHVGSGNYELKVGKNSSSQKVTENIQDFRSGSSKFKIISGEGVNYDVEGYSVLTPEFTVNDRDWLYWIEYIIQLFEGIVDSEGILMWLGDRFGKGGLENLKDITLDSEVIEENIFLKWDNEDQQWKNQKIFIDDLEYNNNLNDEGSGVLLKTNEGWELQPTTNLNQNISNLLSSLIDSDTNNNTSSIVTWNPVDQIWELVDINSAGQDVDIQTELNGLIDTSTQSFLYFDGSDWGAISNNEVLDILGINNSFLSAINNPNGKLLTYSIENNDWEWWDQETLSNYIQEQITRESLLPNASEGQGLIFDEDLDLVGKYIPNFLSNDIEESGIVNWNGEEWKVTPSSDLLSSAIEEYLLNLDTPDSEISVLANIENSIQYLSSEYLRSVLSKNIANGTQTGQGLVWNSEIEDWVIAQQTLESLKQSDIITDDSIISWSASTGDWYLKTLEGFSSEIFELNSLKDISDVEQVEPHRNSLLIWNKFENIWSDTPLEEFKLTTDNLESFSIVPEEDIPKNSVIVWDSFINKWVAGFPEIKIEELFKVVIEPENRRENIILEWDKDLGNWRGKKSIRSLLDIPDVLELETELEDDTVLKWNSKYGQWIPASVSSFGVNYLSDLLDTDVETVDNIPEDDEVLTWSESDQLWIPTPKRKFIGNLDDVSNNVPGTKFLLEWNSSNNEWTPVSPEDVEIPFEIENLSEIGDVELSGDNVPEDNQVLTFDAVNLRWIPSDAGGPETTDDLPEGTINVYFTESRVDTRLGEVSITSIGDVNTTRNPPIDGNILRWNQTENEWVPEDANNLSINLNSLNNVDLSSVANNDLLKYNLSTGTWETFNLSSISISNSSILELSDVNSTTPQTGQVLRWNGTNWISSTIETGISNINDIDNVITDNIQNSEGQILEWSEFNNAWVRADFPEVSQSIDSLSDTNVTNVNSETGQFLLWNESASQWERSSTTLDSLTITDLSSIGNVDNNTTPENNQILKWDQANNRWLRGFVSIDDLLGVQVTGDVNEDLLLIWDGLLQVWKRDSLTIRVDFLRDIENVETNNLTPSTTQYLGWNNSDSRWERKELPSIPDNIQDLSNVDIDNESELDNQVLLWNTVAGNWVRSSGNINSLISMNIEQLGNVVTNNITPNSNNQLLVWNNSSGQWQRAELDFSSTDLSDFSNSSPSDNDILRWSSTNSQWEPFSLGIGTSDLNDFNYDINNISNGDLLKWDGTNWSPSSTIGDLGDLNNTNVNNPSNNQILKWNQSGGVWFSGEIQNFNEISDVSIDYPNISDNNLLVYNYGQAQWETKSLSDFFTSINQIADVDTETVPPSSGYVIAWDGNQWASQVTPLENNIISNLSNVSTTVPTNNQILAWDQVAGNWTPKDIEISSLSSINDVNSGIAPQDRHALVWDGNNSQWISEFPVIQNLDDINIVEINSGTLVQGSILQWDNATSKWVNGTLDLSINELNEISNVDTTTNGKADNYGLFWNTASSSWISKPIPNDYSTINIYNDVNIDSNTITNESLLIYNYSLSQWENKELSDLISSIDDLEDVDTTTTAPVVDNVLKWNGSDWIPGSVSVSVSSLGSLGDVDLTTNAPNIDNVLKWNGSDWVPSGVSVNLTSIDSLGDVDVSSQSLQDNQILYWNNSEGLWKNKYIELDSINDIIDVDTSSIPPQDKDILSWDGANSIWKPQSLSITQLNNIEDVDIDYASLTNNSIIKWDFDNSKWIQFELDISINNLEEIGDVDVSTNGKSDNYGLFWNSSLSQWVSKELPIDYSTINIYDDVNINYGEIENSDILIYNTSLTQWESNSVFTIIDTIDKLPDVDTTTTVPETGFALIWDGSNWIPQQPSVNITSIDEIEDVDTTTNVPQNNQVLTWDQDNTVWKPKDITVDSINNLSDVNTESTPPQNGNTLVWDDANGIWKPAAISISSINDIDEINVNAPALTDNSILQWDTNSNKWVNTELTIELDTISQINNVDVTTNGKSNNYVLLWDADSQNWVSQAIPFDYSTINLLEDVDTELTGDNNVLTWIESEGLWKPKAVELQLGELANVETTDSTGNGKLIVWNESESKWQESTKTINELGFSALGEIPDVTLTNIADKQMLVWSDADSAWINQGFAFNVEDLQNIDTESEGKLDGYLLVWSQNLNTWQTRPLSLASTSIGGLGDVNTSNITAEDNQILVWNGGSNQWERESLTGLTPTLNSIGNVDTSVNSPADQQFLLWSEVEGKWIRSNLTIDSLGLSTLNDIDDVDTESTPPQDQSLLAWNSSSSLWKPFNKSDLFTSLNLFQDVTIPETINEGQIIKWNSVEEKWTVQDPGLTIESTDDVPEGTTNFYFTQARLTAFLETLSVGNLSDVNLQNETPAQGAVLAWNETSSTWVVKNNGLLTESDLSDIGNVGDTSNIEDGNILKWDAENEEWGIGGSRLLDLYDVERRLIIDGVVIDPFTYDQLPDNSILKWSASRSAWTISESKLASASDVDPSLASPADGAILLWDSDSETWVEGPGLETTDGLPEGQNNKYFTTQNLNDALDNSELNIIGDVAYSDGNNPFPKDQGYPLIWDTNLSSWKPDNLSIPDNILQVLNNSTLSELLDVDYDTPSNGQVLAWDEPSGQWIPQESASPESTDDIPEGNSNLYYKDSYVTSFLSSSTLDIFGDVSTETLSDGDVLVWNNTESYWENKSNNDFVSDLLGDGNIDTFGDVNYSSPEDGDVLVWNNTENYWENKSNNQFISDLLNGGDLNVFGDVNYSNPQNGQVLIWDDNAGHFITDNPSNITIISDDVQEGSTNLYFTENRVSTVIADSSINNLNDVSDTDPDTSDVLLWDNFNSEWEPTPLELSTLKDVDDSDRESDSLLFWNNGSDTWETFKFTFNFIPEVNINNPQNDDSLVWDANTNQWVAKRPNSRINLEGTARSDKSSTVNVDAEKIYVDGSNSLYLEDLGGNEVRLTYDLELPIYERGDLLFHNGNEYTRLILGEERQVLTVDRTVFGGITWEDPRLPLLRLGNLAANYTLIVSDHSYIYRVVDSILVTLPINGQVPIGFKCTFKVDTENTTLQFSSFARIRGDNRTFTIKENYVTAFYEGIVNEEETWSIYVEGFNYLDLSLFGNIDVSNSNNNEVLTYNSSSDTWIPAPTQPKFELEGKQYSDPQSTLSGVGSKLILENDLYVKDIAPNGEARIGNKLNLPLTNLNSIITYDGSNPIETYTTENNALLVSTGSGLNWIKNYHSFLSYKTITQSTYTIISEDHGKILKIVNDCDITLPTSLEEGFYVDIRKESLDNTITVSGSLLNDLPDLTSQYESITLLYENGDWLSEYNGGSAGGSGGGGLIVSSTKSSDFTATENTSNPCNTSSGQVICTLPDPDESVKVQIFDSAGVNPEDPSFPNGFSKYSLIIQPNTGQTIQGSSENLFLDNENSSITLIYNPSSKRWSISDGIFFNDINVVSNHSTSDFDFTEYDRNILSYSPFVYLPFRNQDKDGNLNNYGSKEEFDIHKTDKDRLTFNGDNLTIKVTNTTGSPLEDDHYLYRNMSISSTFSVAFKLKLTKDTNINEYIRFLWLFGNEFSIDSSHTLVSSDGSTFNFNATDSDDFSTWTSIVYNINQGYSSDLYFNGRPKATQDQIKFSNNENDLIKIGLLNSGTNEKFNGIQIKDFAVFNRQLNEEERILLADE